LKDDISKLKLNKYRTCWYHLPSSGLLNTLMLEIESSEII
jgi:hypothetical protein